MKLYYYYWERRIYNAILLMYRINILKLNLITLLNNLGDQGIAALIVVFALIFVYRKVFK